MTKTARVYFRVLHLLSPIIFAAIEKADSDVTVDTGGVSIDLSNRPGRPFWPVVRPEKRRAGPAWPNTVAGRAGTTQKERAVLGQGCQPACHAGRPAVPASRASPPTIPILIFHIKLSIIPISTNI